MYKPIYLLWIIAFLLISCAPDVNVIINEKQNKLTPSAKLKMTGEKRFLLDSLTAPKSRYTQIFKDQSGIQYFTFINRFNNTIYLYDYSNCQLFDRIGLKKDGNNPVPEIDGYFIKSLDSIFFYNKYPPALFLFNSKGKILKKYSLQGNPNDPSWYIHYPQYVFQTVTPLFNIKDELFIPGQFVSELMDSLINKFKFVARLNLKSQKIKFSYLYPEELYGKSYNWFGRLFSQTFVAVHPDGDKLIFSFPISHNLYITGLNSEKYSIQYGGANSAETIYSIDKSIRLTSDQFSTLNFAKQNTYSAIIYDKYREVYYRFIHFPIPDSTTYINFQEKPFSVIIMDKNFEYLGETRIGIGEKEWYWQNSFVTEEGLNIQYVGEETEDYIVFKLFTIEKL